MVDSKVRIAVCGGGIGGLTLAAGLSKLDNITFDLYEGSPQLAGTGLGVGLSENAQRAMAMIGTDVRSALDEAGGVPMSPCIEAYMGSGPDFGKLISVIDHNSPRLELERGPLVDALVRKVDLQRIHIGKQIESITEHSAKYEIKFQDGSIAVADAVIGYDGVHSIIRSYILGKDDPATAPRFANYYIYWTSVDVDQGKRALGLTDIPHVQRIWCGKDTFLVYNLISGGKRMMFGAVKPLAEPWEGNLWSQQKTREEVEQDVEVWGQFGKQLAELFLDPKTGEASVKSFWDHADASTYFKGHVCMAGDAAHAMIPFQGAGAGQALEDALVLTKVLEQVRSPNDLTAAFAAYDYVRRPRTQSIVASARAFGLIATARDDYIKGDYEKLKAHLPTKWDHVVYLDTEAHWKEAVRYMQKVVAKEGQV